MVKKILSVFTVASMMLVTSCSNDEFDNAQNGRETTVTFTAQLPDGLQAKTRAYADGTTATRLQYAAYLVENEEWKLTNVTGEATFQNLTTNVSMRLVNGNTYKIVFWADATESIYSFDKDNISVTANYENVASNNEKLDAFFKVEEITVTGADSRTIELRRPFAQLNIGTSDLSDAQKAGREVKKASIKVKTYSKLNFKTENVEGETAEVNFALADLPTNETFPVDGYEYLTMNYLLMPVDKQADNDITILYDNAEERTFQNVPLQRNYRTNIYGNLLTSKEDFKVEIKPDFDNEHNYAVWDGKSTEQPESNDDVYIIKTAAEWIWLKQNGSGNMNIELAADIDFGGHEVKGLGFSGTFDGKGYSMSNMTLLCGGSYYSNGLFQGDASGEVTVKNVTVKDVKAECFYPDNGYVGTIFGDVQNNVTLENVHVVNADLCGVQSVGGLVGFVASGKTLTVTNCSVDGSYIHNYAVDNESGFVAGLVGRPVGTVNVSASEVKNTTINGYYVEKRGENSVQAAIGTVESSSNVTTSAVSVTKTLLDAVVNTTEELKSALTTGKKNIILKAGEFELGGTGFSTDEVTLIGLDKETSIVKVSSSIYAQDKTINLENLTYSVPSGLSYTEQNFAFIHHASQLNIKGCIIEGGRLRINVSNATISDCLFNVTTSSGFDGYGLFYYGNSNSNVTVQNCDFKTAGKAIVMYNESSKVLNLNVDKCTFVSSNSSTDKAAIQMHTEYGISGTLNITNSEASGFKDIHGGLWNEIDNNSKNATQKFKVTVDSQVVQNVN